MFAVLVHASADAHVGQDAKGGGGLPDGLPDRGGGGAGGADLSVYDGFLKGAVADGR